jgi:hypothetical protein
MMLYMITPWKRAKANDGGTKAFERERPRQLYGNEMRNHFPLCIRIILLFFFSCCTSRTHQKKARQVYKEKGTLDSVREENSLNLRKEALKYATSIASKSIYDTVRITKRKEGITTT